MSELLYLLSFSCLLFAKAIGLYEGMTLYNLLLVAGCAFWVLKILSSKHTVFEYMVMAVLMMTGGAVYLNTGEKGIILYLMMMLGLKDVSLKKVFRTGAVIWTVCFGFMAFATQTGIVSEYVLVHPKHFFGETICHTFNYTHPNVLQISYVVLMAFIMYCIDDYMDNRQLILVSAAMMIGNIWVFLNSISFTGFVMGTAYLAFNLYFRIRKSISRPENFLLQAILPFCVLFSVAGPVVLRGTKLFDIINKLLNTRYNLSYYFLTEQRITLLGSRMVVPDYRYTMDCSYVYLLVQLGIIPFILAAVSYFLLIRDQLKGNKRAESAIILGMVTAGVSEPFMFNTSYKNLIFLFLGEYLFRKIRECKAVNSGLLGKQICFTGGLSGIITDKLKDRFGRIEKRIMTAAGTAVLTAVRRISLILPVFVISLAVLTAAYCTVIKEPSQIYVNERYNMAEDQLQTFITDYEALEIRASGGRIYGRNSAEDLMQTVSKETIEHEHYLECLNAGVGTSLLICIIITVIPGSVLRSRKSKGR